MSRRKRLYVAVCNGVLFGLLLATLTWGWAW